jgi:hypothetical protein
VFEGVFSPNFDRKRYDTARQFLAGQKWGGSLRIVDVGRTKVHFSTVERDFASKTDQKAIYRNYIDLLVDPAYTQELPVLSTVDLSNVTSMAFVSPAGKNFQFVVPFNDAKSAQLGWAVFGVPVEDLRLTLLEQGKSLVSGSLLMASPEMAVFWPTTHPESAVFERVKSQLRAGVLPPVQHLAVGVSGGAGGQTLSLVTRGQTSIIVNDSLLTLEPSLKGIILVAFFTVVFLISFLTFSLRGDPVSVASAQIRRLQMQVVKNYLDERNEGRVATLRDELERNQDAIQADIRKHLGRVGKKDSEAIDRFLGKSWKELLDLIEQRVGVASSGTSSPAEPSITLNEFRKLLEETLKRGVTLAPGATAARAAEVRVAEDVEELDEVEELGDAEELDDIEELGEVEELDEVEEAEELEEAEDLAEVEPSDEVEDLEDADGIVDTEAAEQVEDVEELEEAVEELEELESDGGEAELLEELPSNSASGAVFTGYNLQQQDGPLAMLEVQGESDADGGLEDLEELEDLGDESPAPALARVSLSLESLDAAWVQSNEGVFQQHDEVVTLKDEVFTDAQRGDDELARLLDEVSRESSELGFMPLDDQDVPAVVARTWRWTGGGFDWERFAGGDGEVEQFRALSDAVTAFDAFTAAILVPEGSDWKAISSVGFSDSGKAVLRFSAESTIGRDFLSVRELHVLQGGGTNPILREGFHVKDLKFLRTILCIPLLFRREPAWLLLGLRREPGDLLSLLAPRTIS